MSEKTSLVREDGTYPVARTGIGNIALSAVQFEPELFPLHGLERCRIAAAKPLGSVQAVRRPGALDPLLVG